MKAGRDRCFCQRSNGRRFVGALQMPSPPPLLLSRPLSPPFHPTGRDEGITRQERSSQQRGDHTGTALHADRGGVGLMERSGSEPRGLRRPQRRWDWVINVGVIARGQGKGSLAGLWEPAET